MVFRTYDLPVLLGPAQRAAIHAYVAEATVKQGQLVKAGSTNSDEVQPSDADGERVLGIALYDAAAGDTVSVVENGARVRATSGTGTIAAGDPVAAHGATGEAGEVATAASGDYVVGVAYKDDVGDGDDVEIQLEAEGVL